MKKNILIYSGHSEIVGGDVKYIVDILNHLDLNELNITLLIDRGCHFERLAKNWLKINLNIEYLDTYPKLFQPNNFEDFLKFIFSNSHGPIIESVYFKYFNYIYKVLTFYHLRLKIINFISFYNYFSQRKFDVFWFNNGGYPGKEAGLIACIIAKKLFKIKKVMMTFHNIPQERAPYKPFERIYDALTNSSCDKIFAVSKILKSKMVNERSFSDEKIEVVYCGLEDLPALKTEEITQKKLELNIPNDQKIIILTGNLNEPRKGHDFTLEALSYLKAKIKHFHLFCIGNVSDERRNDLLIKISNFNLSENVTLLGPRYDIHELNSIADLALTPSLGSEATPYTIKEAMRASIPVITTNYGGCPEAVIDNITGKVLKDDSPKNFSNAIEEILMNPQRRALGENGRKFFLENFSMKEIIKIYQKYLMEN